MKLRAKPSLRPELQDSFIRGFVSAGLLAVLDGRGAGRGTRRILRLALQGGAALAAGSVAAAALQRRQLTGTVAALAAGAAGLFTIEHLLREKTSKEKDHGQKKA